MRAGIPRRSRRRAGSHHEPVVGAVGGTDDASTARFEESRRLQPDRWHSASPFGPWYPLGALKLRRGDAEGYRALCAEALRQFGGAADGWRAEQLARLCTASPASGVDPERSLELARRALASYPEHPYILLALGAAEYRAGRHEAAVADLARSVERMMPEYPEGRIHARLFLAMAQRRLGHAEEARGVLAEADRAIAADADEIESAFSLLRLKWFERALRGVLRREAGEVLGAADPRAGD